MELTGCCFALDVPPTWRMETNDGVVIATSDESFAGSPRTSCCGSHG